MLKHPKETDLNAIHFYYMDVFFALIIIMFFIGFGLQQYKQQIVRYHVVQAFAFLAPLSKEMEMQYQFSGHWSKQLYTSVDKQQITVKKASIHYHFIHSKVTALQNKTLSLVLYQHPTKPNQARFQWVCGYHSALAGYQAVGKNETTIHTDDLPQFCREN